MKRGKFMCGRFLLESEVEDLVARYNSDYEIEDFKSGEVFPSENPLTVLKNDNKIMLSPMKWGFPMAKSTKLIINARAETASVKPMFKASLLYRRCIIPSNAFFEWKGDKGNKTKFIIRKNGEPIFSMGAVYNNGYFSIITMASKDQMKPIHNRMPFILDRNEEGQWLDSGTNTNALNVLLAAERNIDFIIEPVNAAQLKFF